MKTLFVNIRSVLSIFLLIIVPQLETQSQNQVLNCDREGYVTNSGVRIWYKVEGTSALNSIPLIMIHGGPGATARPFEKTIGPEIAKERQVIYMDNRGSGRSDRPKDPSKYSFAILADDVEAIRKELGIEKLSVFGHSNGGSTAITYALKYPNNVATIILCCPLLSPTDFEMNMVHKVALTPLDQFEQARAIYKSNQSNEVRFVKLLELIDIKTRHKFQYYNPENSAVLDKIQTDLGKEIGKGLMDPELIEGLISNGLFEFNAFNSANELTMPVLFLLGRYDSEISLDNAMKFALTISNGHITLLNNSGHHPYLEETKACMQQINAFLLRHSANLTPRK
ncbi:MAG: alpha/beta fold hydrolase [Bacteroidetes bacterium]|nr:alpha/beta fold hydrolase [Bacteroidota bacterium]